MKNTVVTVLLVIATLAANPAVAEDKLADVTDMPALQKAVKADKKAYVAATLKLSDAEARKFWPIYETYQRAVNVANQRRVVVVGRLIALDRPLSDLYARTLATEMLVADDAEVKARRTMQAQLMRALSPRKAARYLQLESKIRAVLAYDIAATIPLLN